MLEEENIYKSGDRMQQPTITEIIKKLILVIENDLTREELSDWASSYVMEDIPTIDDDLVWELLMTVSGIDIKDSPNEYLHSEDDIKNWIEEFK